MNTFIVDPRVCLLTGNAIEEGHSHTCCSPSQFADNSDGGLAKHFSFQASHNEFRALMLKKSGQNKQSKNFSKLRNKSA